MQSIQIPDYPNYTVNTKGEVYSKTRMLRPRDSRGGYNRVVLYKDGTPKAESVHRLVAKAFLANPKNYKVVNHKDRNPKNNYVENLEWCTDMYNAQSINTSKRVGTIVVSEGPRKTSFRGRVRIFGKGYHTKAMSTKEEAELGILNILKNLNISNE